MFIFSKATGSKKELIYTYFSRFLVKVWFKKPFS